MESVERKKALEAWLCHQWGLPSILLHPMQNDASFRRYYRLNIHDQSFVAMDAPPMKENCNAFVSIANTLRDQGLNAPEIIAANVAEGFLLLTDFGDLTFLKVLTADNADHLYRNALTALSILQSANTQHLSLPFFDDQFMWQEWQWFKEWFLTKLLKISYLNEKSLDQCYAHIVQSAVSQPQVFMHRDFHAANLMLLPNNQVGILDFQDAFIGPITYDLASLLRDCYIGWPKEQVNQWVKYYWQQLNDKQVLNDVSAEEFLQWFDKMCLQRHLKALITFSRKKIRDQHAGYLKHIPLTLAYLTDVSSIYPEVSALHHFLKNEIQPSVNEALTLCGE